MEKFREQEQRFTAYREKNENRSIRKNCSGGVPLWMFFIAVR